MGYGIKNREAQVEMLKEKMSQTLKIMDSFEDETIPKSGKVALIMGLERNLLLESINEELISIRESLERMRGL